VFCQVGLLTLCFIPNLVDWDFMLGGGHASCGGSSVEAYAAWVTLMVVTLLQT
jgi:hypothetical protein